MSPSSRRRRCWALASATRFYFVTWLGERVVADIRKAVFDNVLGLTPQFFEVTRTGEVLSRLTADTTLIQTVVGSSASLALRNLVTLTGGLILMFVTSLKLALLVVGAVVLVMLPLMLFGRWVRKLSPPEPGLHRRHQRPRQRDPERGAHGAGLHPGKLRAPRLSAARWNAPSTSPVARTRARAILTAVAIFTAFASLATVLLVGLQDVIAHRMTGGELVAFIFFGVLVAGGVGSLSEVWGDLQRAAGASERLMELLHEVPAIARARPSAGAAGQARAGAVRFEQCHLPLSHAARLQGAERIFAGCGGGRGGGAGGAQRARANPPSSS